MRFEKIIAVLFIALILVVVFVIGIDSILLAGANIFVWGVFLPCLLLSMGLVADFTYLCFHTVARQMRAEKHVQMSAWPSFAAFRKGRSENALEDFFVVMLRSGYLKNVKIEADNNAYGGDESLFVSFRRQCLPEMVLYSHYRHRIEHMYLQVYRLYRTKKLNPALLELIEDSISLSGQRRTPMLATLTILRVVLTIFSFGKIPLKAGERQRDLGAEHYRQNPQAFVELMDEHFFTIFEELPPLLSAREVAEECALGAREQYREEVKALPARGESSYQSQPKEEPKPPPEATKPEQQRTQPKQEKPQRETTTDIMREVEDNLKQDGEHWNDFESYLGNVVSRISKARAHSAEPEKDMNKLYRIYAKFEEFEDIFDEDFAQGASSNGDFKTPWLRRASAEVSSKFNVESMYRIAFGYYLSDDK